MYRMYVYLSGVLLLALTSGALGEVPGWWNQDINTTGGSATEQNRTITITGDGHDIWGPWDSFHYAYKQFSGNGQITLKR